MKAYYIEVYDPDVKRWVDAFPFDYEGIYDTYNSAKYQVETMKEVDIELGECNQYRIRELHNEEIITDWEAFRRDLGLTEEELDAFVTEVVKEMES